MYVLKKIIKNREFEVNHHIRIFQYECRILLPNNFVQIVNLIMKTINSNIFGCAQIYTYII